MTSPPPPAPPSAEAAAKSTARERYLSGHIFSVSAGLVGVCLTVIGLFNIVAAPNAYLGLADRLIALDAATFLASCLFSYLALRVPDESGWQRREAIADVLFLVGLSGMVVIGGLVAFEFI